MADEITISCGRNGYTATLKGEGLRDIFHAVRSRPELLHKTGEDLIESLLTEVPGAVIKIDRRRKGKHNDGAKGQAAQEHFNEAGLRIRRTHFRDGLRHDSMSGEPAVQWVNDDIIGTVYCQNGKRHDGPNGEPAIQRRAHSGELLYAVSCDNPDGIRTKTLSADERARLRPKI